MREIKFRLWHKKYKLMSYVMAPFERMPINFDVMWLAKSKKTPIGEIEFTKNDVVVLQYTGVKDKHKKEMFESDIVINSFPKFKGVIFFNRGSFWVREFFSNIDEGVYAGDIKKETIWSIDLHYEVIGNIYENPKLLKKAA
jgi:uncharacterized phage protein (TIGR01671 family)